MSKHTVKHRAARLLRRAADRLHPPAVPVILPAGERVPTDPIERARLYEKIAFTAIAWMGHMPDINVRAAAAAILRRTYPGIAPAIAEAHRCAMAFQPQLEELLRAQEAASQREDA